MRDEQIVYYFRKHLGDSMNEQDSSCLIIIHTVSLNDITLA